MSQPAPGPERIAHTFEAKPDLQLGGRLTRPTHSLGYLKYLGSTLKDS